MYKVFIYCGSVEDPEIADNESGTINFSDVQVISIEKPYLAPFDITDVLNAVNGYYRRFSRDPFVQNLMENKPLFIPETSKIAQGVVPASYSITKNDGNPTTVDIDVVYNNGLYHMHLDSSTTSIMITPDNVSYTSFSGVYIVTEFTIEDILGQITAPSPKLTISRGLLDAAYKGAPIMVKSSNNIIGAIPIIVERINNPNEGAAIRFNVQFENIKYEVSCSSTGVLIGNKAMDATIDSYNLVDWNENGSNTTGYIANRTHYHNRYGTFSPGQRYSITDQETIHDLNNYRLLLRGDLFKIQLGDFSIKKDGASIDFNCLRAESGNTVSWLLSPVSFSGFGESEYITVVSKLRDYKPLDEFYLPDACTNGAYIVSEFTVKEIVSSVSDKAVRVPLTISRDLLDAAYKGKPLMVKFSTTTQGATTLITVDEILNPSKSTFFKFRVKHGNTEYSLLYNNGNVITGTTRLSVDIVPYNLVDWNENDTNITGYIANRTHYGEVIDTISPGQRFSIGWSADKHGIDSYRIRYKDQLYKLPTTVGEAILIEDNYTKTWFIQVIYSGESKSGNTSTYTFTTNTNPDFNYSAFNAELKIISNRDPNASKKLDTLFLPDEVLCESIPVSEIESFTYTEE